MEVLERIRLAGLVPVVVVETADEAVKTADALLAGGVDIMEITMRTAAGIDAIRAVKQENPEILVGAGTVLSLDKAEECRAAGAEFIVMPGFNDDIVRWCVDKGIPVTPGCVTPTEIDRARAYNLRVLKFFPAGVYGGLEAMKALNGPYRDIAFIPTGGITVENLGSFASEPYIHALGGSWLCSSKDIAAGAFNAITTVAQLSVERLLGFDLAHVGINGDDEETARRTADVFSAAFGFGIKSGSSSIMAGTGIEVTKKPGPGRLGHLAIQTNNLDRAVYYLGKRGFNIDDTSWKMKDGKAVAVYLEDEIGGFAIHLLQK